MIWCKGQGKMVIKSLCLQKKCQSGDFDDKLAMNWFWVRSEKWAYKVSSPSSYVISLSCSCLSYHWTKSVYVDKSNDAYIILSSNIASLTATHAASLVILPVLIFGKWQTKR